MKENTIVLKYINDFSAIKPEFIFINKNTVDLMKQINKQKNLKKLFYFNNQSNFFLNKYFDFRISTNTMLL